MNVINKFYLTGRYYILGGNEERKLFDTVELHVNFFPLTLLLSLIKNLYNLKTNEKLEKI
jgi:hypothetical protein